MGLTGVAMETMRPSGPVKLESIESGIYKEVGLTVLFARGIVTGVVVGGGGEHGVLNLLLPVHVPFTLSSGHILSGSHLLFTFSVAKYYVMLSKFWPFLLVSTNLGMY